MTEPDSRPGLPVVLVADALATNADNLIPLVCNMGNWWLPGGRVEPGESITAAAVREVREETGLILEPHGVVRIAQQIEDDRRVVFVTVRGSVDGQLQAPEADPKINEVRWASPGELDDLVPDMAVRWRELLTAPAVEENIE